MSDLTEEKALAANRSLTYVQSGMLIGLGSGQTAAFVIGGLGERVRRGEIYINVVTTSQRSADLASKAGLTAIPFDGSLKVDLTIDGADEIGPGLVLNKGGAGALLREKILAFNSEKLIIVADSRKPVRVLGTATLTTEVLPFGWVGALKSMREEFNIHVIRRLDSHGNIVLTEQGNYLLDCLFGHIPEPEVLSQKLRNIPGVLETGLFVGLASLAIVAKGMTIQELGRDWDGNNLASQQ